jgi:hypothetical protein
MHKYGYRLEVGDIIKDENRHFTITDRTHNREGVNNKFIKKYKYTCNICGWTEGWMNEYRILNGNKCSCCQGAIVVEGINDIPTTAPWMTKYFQGGYDEAKLYTQSSNHHIIPICSDCNSIKHKSMPISNIYNRRSIGCNCGDAISYSEKIMHSILQQLNQQYIPEYNPSWIKPKRFDFYLINQNIIIEMDGAFHKKYNGMTNETAEDTQLNDSQKDELAKREGVDVIRIDCFVPDIIFIKNNILKSRLSEHLAFEDVNWMKCDEYAQRNIIKDVCKRYDEYNESTKVIGEFFKIAQGTVVNYLKKGNKLGWCVYDGKIASKNRARKRGDLLSKVVEVYKDGVFIEEYISTAELKRRSMQDFGVEFSSACISYVCNGRFSQHKGYVLKYKDKENSIG